MESLHQALKNKNRRLGTILVLLVASVWIASSFLVQSLEGKGIRPFFITYVANSLFVIYLPLYAFLRKKRRCFHAKGSAYESFEETKLGTTRMEVEERTDDDDHDMQPNQDSDMTEKELIMAALKISPLWFAAQWTFNASLASTSVTSNTILSSSSNMFTFLLAVALIGESYTNTKMFSIVTVILGIAAVSIADAAPAEDGSRHSIFGDGLCLLSAFFYGLYTVILRKELADDEKVSMTLFFGCIGLFNLTLFMPVLMVYHWYHPEILHQSPNVIGLCVAKGLFDNVLSDYLWARAVLLLGPTLATVGLSLQVPMAIVAEFFVGSATWKRSLGRTTLTLAGGGLVLGGFFGLQREELIQEVYA